jgi:hypothetical protein
MNWNPWKHIRLAGTVTCLVAAIISNVLLSFIGLMLIAAGVVGGLDRLERLFNQKFPEEGNK